MWAAQVTAWPCKKYKGGTVVGNPRLRRAAQYVTLLFPAAQYVTLLLAGSQMVNSQGAYLATHVDFIWVTCIFANWKIVF